MDIKQLLELAVKSHASDLHILPGVQPLLRINGVLDSIKDSTVLSADETHKMIYSLMSEEEHREFGIKLVSDLPNAR